VLAGWIFGFGDGEGTSVGTIGIVELRKLQRP